MHKITRPLAALLFMALVLVACGGDEGDTGGDTAATTTTTTTTTTPTTSSADEVSTTSSSTTTEAPDLGPLMPLSGEPIGDDPPADHAAVVVKISTNDARARNALMGLDQADIIYEERIEQQATRFAAVFHSRLPEEVGSVRSGRTSDVDIVSNLNRPVFAYSGANDGVSAQLRQAENEGLLIRSSSDLGHSDFSRISLFSAPDNLVANVATLAERAEGGEPPTPVFDFSDTVIELGQPSAGVRVGARDDAIFVWSATDNGYLRFQDRTGRHGTRNGIQLAPTNVVILTTTYLPSTIDAASVDAVIVGEGDAVVFSGGFRVEGTWSREFERDPYTLTTPDGQTIGLAAGQTWVSLTPAGTAAEISAVEGNALKGS